jgi:hypothetical protein
MQIAVNRLIVQFPLVYESLALPLEQPSPQSERYRFSAAISRTRMAIGGSEQANAGEMNTTSPDAASSAVIS